MEFVDDYERPVLEKYEKITPTPLDKKAKVDDTPKVKLHITLYITYTSLNSRNIYFKNCYII